MGYRACLGLLSLARRYGNARLEDAAERAVQLRAFTGRSVRNLLQQGLDRQPLPKRAAATTLPEHHENPWRRLLPTPATFSGIPCHLKALNGMECH